ncbi:unnamed protein product [Adineta steineri]|uniref:Uncharacterized protein n=2 Tax=Adineta steineri TaxID=433720 RepID=A0A819LXB8_9BILA|nr:unnamed protein product [Adineta steineri]
MSPYSNHDLDLINTQCAEQCFAWLKRYAAIISSLGWMRAPLYLMILFHYKNLSTCHVRPTKHFNIDHLVPNVPNISLSHAASLQQDDHLPLSDLNNNLNTNISDITKNIIQSNRFAENNKWMIMSARIPHNVQSASANTTLNLLNDVDNKWTKITDKIISSSILKSKRSNKRKQSPNIHNKWIDQVEKILKQYLAIELERIMTQKTYEGRELASNRLDLLIDDSNALMINTGNTFKELKKQSNQTIKEQSLIANLESEYLGTLLRFQTAQHGFLESTHEILDSFLRVEQQEKSSIQRKTETIYNRDPPLSIPKRDATSVERKNYRREPTQGKWKRKKAREETAHSGH